MKWNDSSKIPKHYSTVLVEFEYRKSGWRSLETYAAGKFYNWKEEDPDMEDSLPYIKLIDEEDVEIHDFKNQVKRWTYLE